MYFMQAPRNSFGVVSRRGLADFHESIDRLGDPETSGPTGPGAGWANTVAG